MQWLDLVALGTVCDMLPLLGVNRAFVAQGLKVIAQHNNKGIQALTERAGLYVDPEGAEGGMAYRLFFLGPCVNAGGRVGQADLGAQLL